MQCLKSQLHPQLSLQFGDCTSSVRPLYIAAIMNSSNSISGLFPMARRDQIILSLLSFAECHSGQFPSFPWQVSQLYFLCVSQRSWTCEINCLQLLGRLDDPFLYWSHHVKLDFSVSTISFPALRYRPDLQHCC